MGFRGVLSRSLRVPRKPTAKPASPTAKDNRPCRPGWAHIMTVLEPSTNPAHRTIDRTHRIRVGMRVHGAAAHQGLVDGAWWPRSLDLAAELPALIEALIGTGFDARRVSYSLEGWQHVPRRLNASGRVLKLGGFNTLGTAIISVIDSSGRARLELVVIPPGSDKAFAARVLAAGRDASDSRRADEMLEAAADTE